MQTTVKHTNRRTGVKRTMTIQSRNRMGYEITIKDGPVTIQWDIREKLQEAIAFKRLYKTQMKNNRNFVEG